MKAITTIKRTPIPTTFIIENADGQLIGTAAKMKRWEEDACFGEYRVCMVGGAAHGKISYAADWEQLNEKSVSIANLYAQTA